VGDFTVYISVPLDDPLGTLYDVNLSLTFDGTDIDLTNNDDLAKIMISTMTYLPLIPGGLVATISPDNLWGWLVYLLLARALRRADQEGTARGTRGE